MLLVFSDVCACVFVCMFVCMFVVYVCGVGQIKTIATTVVGLFLFGDVVISPLNSIGLFIGVFGSLWYSFVKYRQQTSRTPPSPATAAAAATTVTNARTDRVKDRERDAAETV